MAGEGGIARGEGRAKKEGGGAVGQGSLIGKEDIRDAADKTIVEVHGGQVPSEAIPEEDAHGKVGCMKVGRGEHVEIEGEGDRLDASSGRYSGRVQKRRHKITGEGNMRIYA